MADACKVFVGNLPYDYTEDDLHDIFGNSGTIEEAIVIKDRDTGRSRGFGFVTFSSENEAQDAIKDCHGKEHNGRDLTVREAESKRGGGGGYGGGRGGYGGGGYGGGRQGGYGGGRQGGYGGGRQDGGGYRGGGRRGYNDSGYGGGYGGGKHVIIFFYTISVKI